LQQASLPASPKAASPALHQTPFEDDPAIELSLDSAAPSFFIFCPPHPQSHIETAKAARREGKMIKFNWGMRACGMFLLWATTAIALPAQTFSVLHSFDYGDGAGPNGTLVQATNGNLYGTTGSGGANSGGVVYKISTGGTLQALHSFATGDGFPPYAGLVQATNGNFYGTTSQGGANSDGTVFKITANGTFTVLHSFDNTDGASAQSALVQGINGKFYGTTQSGGANSYGTVFSITATGTLTTLHSFDQTDGYNVTEGLIQATNGKFYGTTPAGGSNGYGTVYKMTTNGTLTTLHSFDSTNDGTGASGLIQGTNGNFYGTTNTGGANAKGTVFKITPGGTLTTLYSFCSQLNCTDGAESYVGLFQGTDGNFYGTTQYGGANNNSICSNAGCGTIFKITPGGTLTTLYSFCAQLNCTDGFGPRAGLVQDTNGTFYGTTSGGGTSNASICLVGPVDGCGVVFSLSVGLGPFVETRPLYGTVGAAVKILGTSLTGSTSVTFNGTAATFTVVSGSEITTTVPTGATTGTVQVVTPGGTLSSNVPFTVTP
jgi:uncharacterized repeat protein (TIGR03803 family)